MSRYHTVAVPFIKIGNRRALTDKQCAEQPWLGEFVERFGATSFERDEIRHLWLFVEPENVEVANRAMRRS